MRSAVAALSVLALAAAGCGGEEEPKNALTATACAASAATGAVSLPTSFPVTTGVTYAGSTPAGPSTITSGTGAGSLGSIYDAFKADLAKAPYSVTKSEKDKDDAEVNFAGPDTTGQVKLRDCGGGKVAVEVTARPR